MTPDFLRDLIDTYRERVKEEPVILLTEEAAKALAKAIGDESLCESAEYGMLKVGPVFGVECHIVSPFAFAALSRFEVSTSIVIVSRDTYNIMAGRPSMPRPPVHRGFYESDKDYKDAQWFERAMRDTT